MNAPAAIRAVYTDYRRVKGRKIHQVTFEIPSELWPDVYAFLGEPTIENSDWFGIARLNPEPKASKPADQSKRKLSELPAAQQAALTCQREAFWRFLSETRGIGVSSEEEAAEYVRRSCGVKSRSEITNGSLAGDRWNLLLSAFDAWMQVPA